MKKLLLLLTLSITSNFLAQNGKLVGTIPDTSMFSNISQKIIQDTTPKTIRLASVEIEGIRSDEKTPITQKIITKSDIQSGYFGQDAPILFQSTPSIILEADGGDYTGYMYYRLRGIDQTRVNTTLNGISLNEPEDQGAYFSNYTDLLNNMNSIQIQRGVGTSTNGSASYAGSINMESVNLLDSNYINLQTGLGSYNSNRFSLGYNSGLKDNFAFYGRYSSTYSDGFREHSGTNASLMFFSGAYYSKKDIIKLTAFTGHSENSMAYLASNVDTLKKDFTNNPLSYGEADHFVQTFVQLQDIKTLTSNSFLTSSLYYTGLQGNYGVLGVINPTTLSDFQLFSDWYGSTTNYNYEKNKSWSGWIRLLSRTLDG